MNQTEAIALAKKNIANGKALVDVLKMILTMPVAEIAKRHDNDYITNIVVPVVTDLIKPQINILVALDGTSEGDMIVIETITLLTQIKGLGQQILETLQAEEAKEQMKSAIFKAKKTAFA